MSSFPVKKALFSGDEKYIRKKFKKH